MTVYVTFHRDDTASWAKLEDAIGSSTSNRDNGPDMIDLIWKELDRDRALRIVEAATQNIGVQAIFMDLTTPRNLRLIP